ncbi:MAG: methylated-DNA--[protein]-cysteine S-methyltransferase [Chloroflexi bacterium]|nr:methylated-DNA--[protein]-cysteine S-methyltransferase [Chloroflexota bacterium]
MGKIGMLRIDAIEIDDFGHATFSTPAGPLHVAYSGDTVRYADLGVGETDFVAACIRRFEQRPSRGERPPERLRRAVERFLDGSGPFEGDVDLSGLTEFQRRVLQKTLEIRRGEVRPYHWVAREIRAPGAVRAVGSALARNPIPILIPCHRVVRADYHVGAYGCGGPEKKREILRHEGVDIEALEGLARRGTRFLGSKTTHSFCLLGCAAAQQVRPDNRVGFGSAGQAQAAGFRPCQLCRPA